MESSRLTPPQRHFRDIVKAITVPRLMQIARWNHFTFMASICGRSSDSEFIHQSALWHLTKAVLGLLVWFCFYCDHEHKVELKEKLNSRLLVDQQPSVSNNLAVIEVNELKSLHLNTKMPYRPRCDLRLVLALNGWMMRSNCVFFLFPLNRLCWVRRWGELIKFSISVNSL